MNTKNKSKNAQDFIAKICDEYGTGDFIFRGTTKVFSGDDDGVNSSLYRWAEDEGAIDEDYTPPMIEKEIVDDARRHFPDKTSNIEILTDIRHYGGRVNLIDFTYNLYVSLFFACNGNFDEDGEIIILNKKQLSLIPEIKYDDDDSKEEGARTGAIEPAKTQTSQLRVVAQDSIFVYFDEGYIGKPYFKDEKIPKELKKDILDYIRKITNINQNTIYNDLIGFIANEENYDKARIFFYKGRAKSSLGKYEEAIEDYSKAIERNPQFIRAYYNRGVTNRNLRRDEEAIKDYSKAIELDPQFTVAYNNRGLSKHDLGKYQEAIKDYDKAIAINSQPAVAYNNRGLSKNKLGKYKEAIKDYNQAIEIDPEDIAAYINRGNANSSLGKHKEAIKDYNQAIELNPQYAEAYCNRGLSKFSLGKYEEAIKDYDKVLELDPNFIAAIAARVNRENAKRKLGDETEAAENVAKAKELKKSKPDD